MSEWQPIETAPATGEFLAFGAYRYPNDKRDTQFIRIVEFTGDQEWPLGDQDGWYLKGAFSHWMPLPEPPE